MRVLPEDTEKCTFDACVKGSDRVRGGGRLRPRWEVIDFFSGEPAIP